MKNLISNFNNVKIISIQYTYRSVAQYSNIYDDTESRKIIMGINGEIGFEIIDNIYKSFKLTNNEKYLYEILDKMSYSGNSKEYNNKELIYNIGQGLKDEDVEKYPNTINLSIETYITYHN